MISGTADPKFRSDLHALSKASPIAEVAVSSNQTFWVGVVFIVTSREARAGALYYYCLSVTEAQSRFGDGRTCSFNGELSDQNRPPCGLRANMPTGRCGRAFKLTCQIRSLGFQYWPLVY